MARLPSPPKLQDPVLQEYLTRLVQALEKEHKVISTRAMTKDRIKVTGNTDAYTFDASAATLAELRNVVATLLTQLQRSGDIA
jgi:hypothetical protein